MLKKNTELMFIKSVSRNTSKNNLNYQPKYTVKCKTFLISDKCFLTEYGKIWEM